MFNLFRFHSLVLLKSAYQTCSQHNIDWSTAIEDAVSTPHSHTFEQADTIVVFDCVEKSTSSFKLRDQDLIQTCHRTLRDCSNLCT